MTIENKRIEEATHFLSERREFLKKAAYTAPTLIALGGLLKPTRVRADQSGGPPPPPNPFSGFEKK